MRIKIEMDNLILARYLLESWYSVTCSVWANSSWTLSSMVSRGKFELAKSKFIMTSSVHTVNFQVLILLLNQ